MAGVCRMPIESKGKMLGRYYIPMCLETNGWLRACTIHRVGISANWSKPRGPLRAPLLSNMCGALSSACVQVWGNVEVTPSAGDMPHSRPSLPYVWQHLIVPEVIKSALIIKEHESAANIESHNRTISAASSRAVLVLEHAITGTKDVVLLVG
jgi:hypothetical protein